jgi:hypothetical protein
MPDKKVQRNIKRNLRRFDDNRVDTVELTFSVAGKVCAVLLVFFLPFAALFGTTNLIFRVPDLYQFDLDRTDITREIRLDMKGKELGELIARYMQHKTDDFRPAKTVDFQGKQSSIFTRTDRIAMEHSRGILDKTLIAFFLLFPVTIAIIVLLLRFGQRRDLWIGYNAGLILYGLLALSLLVFGSFPRDRYATFQWMTDVRFTKMDILPQLFDNGFYVEAMGFVVAISAIILFVCRSVLKKLTVLDKMF